VGAENDKTTIRAAAIGNPKRLQHARLGRRTLLAGQFDEFGWSEGEGHRFATLKP